MAFFCPARARPHPKKAREVGDGIEGANPCGRGGLTRSWTKRKMTGSTSIETLVLVGLEAASGTGGVVQGGAYAEAMRTVTRQHVAEMEDEVSVNVGQTVVVIFRDEDWLYVVSDKGAEGFIPRENCVRSKKMRARPQDDNGNADVVSPPGDQNGNKSKCSSKGDVEERLKAIQSDLKKHVKLSATGGDSSASEATRAGRPRPTPENARRGSSGGVDSCDNNFATTSAAPPRPPTLPQPPNPPPQQQQQQGRISGSDLRTVDSRSRESLASQRSHRSQSRLDQSSLDPKAHVFHTSSGKIELSDSLAKHIGSTPRKSPKMKHEGHAHKGGGGGSEVVKMKGKKSVGGTRSPSFVSPLQQCIKEGRLKDQDSQRLTTSMMLHSRAEGVKGCRPSHHGSHQVLFEHEARKKESLFNTPQHRSAKRDSRAIGVVPPHVMTTSFGNDSSSGCHVDTSSSSLPSPPQHASTTTDLFGGVDSGTGMDSRWGDKSSDSEVASTSSSSAKEVRQTWRQRKMEMQRKDRRDASSLEDKTDLDTPNALRDPGSMTLPASFRKPHGAVPCGSEKMARRRLDEVVDATDADGYLQPLPSRPPNNDLQRTTQELKDKLVLTDANDQRKTKVIQENIPVKFSGGKSVAMTRKYWLIPENLNISEIKIFSRLQHGDALALWDFFAVEENDVSLIAGEKVTVLNDEDPDWTWVLKGDGDEGFVPANHLGPRAPNPELDSPSPKRTPPAGKVSVIVHAHEGEPAMDIVKQDVTSPGVLTRLDDTFLHDHFGVVRLIAEFDFQDPRVPDFVVNKDEFLLADMVGQSDEEWLWVTACSSGQQGWIPKNFVKQISYVD